MIMARNPFFWILSSVNATMILLTSYNQIPHLTQDTTFESDKNTIKYHREETRGQPFPSR